LCDGAYFTVISVPVLGVGVGFWLVLSTKCWLTALYMCCCCVGITYFVDVVKSSAVLQHPHTQTEAEIERARETKRE